MYHVVGGGIAGLAAAYSLKQRGHEVRIFEGSEQLGGLAASYETAGDPIEKFYHHLSKSEQTIVGLADELGVGDRIDWRLGKNAYFVDGEAYPMDTPWEILAYPHMNLYDIFRLGMLTMEVDVRGGIPSFDTYEDLTAFEDVPIKQFLVEHTTRGVYENFFEPLLDAKFGDRKEEVSAAWLLGRIKFRGERDLLRGEILGYPDGGFDALLEPLIEEVGRDTVQTNTRVTDLGTEDGEVATITTEQGEETETHDTDGVVVATMPNVLEGLTGYTCEIDFQGAVCAVVTMDRPLTDTYWLNIADDVPFGALIEHTNFVPPERYGGDHLLYVASYVQSDDEWLATADDEEIENRWLGAIEGMHPEFDREHVEQFRLAKAPRAAPIYERGYLDMVVPYDLEAEVADGLYYAGMASESQYPERSLDGGIVAGFECANLIDRKAE
ncbi:NAD(P)/FAD-dependent oxidoreductase [Halolamina salifodinae]|uniref:Protoporphyrinogen oxidase n=1 Tax=Halolamina salifodinae TaxID=1202767 RepID=A0A8T4GXH4_9EURY|nr:NAD(P)/FAD-dependent oxidoreductase [Halolamina salifodinae]MBP1987656.1 protoporphyrinogen oxidase [Halolamina salifodinae]